MFVFGNNLTGEQQVENILFAKLIAMNTLNFDFNECSFTEKGMVRKDKNGQSKEGTGRVAILKETGIVHCYTIECNYHNGKKINSIPPKFNKITKMGEAETPMTDPNSKIYTSHRASGTS